MSAVLFVVVPHWAPARASVHPDPDAAVRAATQEHGVIEAGQESGGRRPAPVESMHTPCRWIRPHQTEPGVDHEERE